ncbi:unnamed protein product [Cuscuta epithymum]|uniref:Uncharacterized protein n=3 Tax=Cuscuta epithymum TaxID=186058 RepID=A0AAV0DIU2_9ASTE|nr:unnamed protein product [Cuscuta epithymum]
MNPEMTTSLGNHPCLFSRRVHVHCWKERSVIGSYFSYLGLSCIEQCSPRCKKFMGCFKQDARKPWKTFASKMDGGDKDPNETEDEVEEEILPENSTGSVNNDILREKFERIVGNDDSSFSGIDLATLIRNKYGRSYDVQLIKKEFMGKNLLALNVMWKYMEQRSFPLTEEEYLLRLDDVANTLKCWGAVSHVRCSIEKLKERPRVGKAVSIFIDMDASGGRASEWIYK